MENDHIYIYIYIYNIYIYRKFLNFVPPGALKMHSLAVLVLRFFCKTFSELCKLNNETLFSVNV